MMLLTLLLGFAALGPNNACVLPQGINDSGDGGLDLATMQDTLGMEPFDFANPIIPTIATCAGGLETPISMRTLLGKINWQRPLLVVSQGAPGYILFVVSASYVEYIQQYTEISTV